MPMVLITVFNGKWIKLKSYKIIKVHFHYYWTTVHYYCATAHYY